MRSPTVLRAELIHDTSDVVDAFNTATEQEPWTSLPEEERINFLRNLIEPLLEAGLAERLDRGRGSIALRIAASHGERRHEQGLPDSILIEDVYYFRRAIYEHIARHGEDDDCARIITRIDELLSRAFMASLYGYYREKFEARGEWPDAVEGLLGDV
jgi:hypothetical protein